MLRLSPVRWLRDAQRARAADRILEQLECHDVSNPEIVECHAVPQVAAMKEHLLIIAQADETTALAHEQPGNPAGCGLPARIGSRRLAQHD